MKPLKDMLDELVDTQTQLPAHIYFKFDKNSDNKYIGILYGIIEETIHIKFLNKNKETNLSDWVILKINVTRSNLVAEIDHDNTEHYVSNVGGID